MAFLAVLLWTGEELLVVRISDRGVVEVLLYLKSYFVFSVLFSLFFSSQLAHKDFLSLQTF